MLRESGSESWGVDDSGGSSLSNGSFKIQMVQQPRLKS